MSDYSEQGAVPVEDAAVADPPTLEEVVDRQRREHPDQVRPATTKPVPLPVDAPVDGDNGGA
jgi:hypothetical protein